jgi:hypothetical protein
MGYEAASAVDRDPGLPPDRNTPVVAGPATPKVARRNKGFKWAATPDQDGTHRCRPRELRCVVHLDCRVHQHSRVPPRTTPADLTETATAEGPARMGQRESPEGPKAT